MKTSKDFHWPSFFFSAHYESSGTERRKKKKNFLRLPLSVGRSLLFLSFFSDDTSRHCTNRERKRFQKSKDPPIVATHTQTDSNSWPISMGLKNKLGILKKKEEKMGKLDKSSWNLFSLDHLISICQSFFFFFSHQAWVFRVFLPRVTCYFHPTDFFFLLFGNAGLHFSLHYHASLLI